MKSLNFQDVIIVINGVRIQGGVNSAVCSPVGDMTETVYSEDGEATSIFKPAMADNYTCTITITDSSAMNQIFNVIEQATKSGVNGGGITRINLTNKISGDSFLSTKARLQRAPTKTFNSSLNTRDFVFACSNCETNHAGLPDV
jgi:hypothetical protein